MIVLCTVYIHTVLNIYTEGRVEEKQNCLHSNPDWGNRKLEILIEVSIFKEMESPRTLSIRKQRKLLSGFKEKILGMIQYDENRRRKPRQNVVFDETAPNLPLIQNLSEPSDSSSTSNGSSH